jgi:hypothetical protein
MAKATVTNEKIQEISKLLAERREKLYRKGLSLEMLLKEYENLKKEYPSVTSSWGKIHGIGGQRTSNEKLVIFHPYYEGVMQGGWVDIWPTWAFEIAKTAFEHNQWILLDYLIDPRGQNIIRVEIWNYGSEWTPWPHLNRPV